MLECKAKAIINVCTLDILHYIYLNTSSLSHHLHHPGSHSVGQTTRHKGAVIGRRTEGQEKAPATM